MKTILVDAVDTFIVEEGSAFKIFQAMYDLLETFPNRKIILTNANDEQMKTFNLTDLPYELFSLKHNPDKVVPEYFEKMLNHFQLVKNDVVYFEHSLEAVKSAESVGIKAYHYDPGKKDLESLKKFLNKNL